MEGWVYLRFVVVLLVSSPLHTQSFTDNHLMDLYRGLVNQNYSDIVLAIDSAEGVKEGVFNGTKNLSELAVHCLSHVKQTRIAVMSFSDKVNVVHSFKDCQTEDCIIKSLRSIRIQKGKRATARALKEAKKILKNGGERKQKWTVVLITFGAPRIGKKRTLVVSQRLRRAGADMYILGVGRRAFNNYETLKKIVKPFEDRKGKMVNRLFLFRGPQHRKDFIMTKAVLKMVCSNRQRGVTSVFG